MAPQIIILYYICITENTFDYFKASIKHTREYVEYKIRTSFNLTHPL